MLVVPAVVALGACGSAKRVQSQASVRTTALQATIHGRPVCGRVLERVMDQVYISPYSSVALRERARKTLNYISTHWSSLTPMCAARSSVPRSALDRVLYGGRQRHPQQP
jgi:hypothetical protein